MAKLMLHGRVADIRIESDYRDDELIYAVCSKHGVIKDQNGCGWEEGYDDLNDAVEYASDHADGVR